MPAGRPKKTIDWELVQKLCNIHCTGEEIACILDIHYDTLNNRCNEVHGCNFSEYYKKTASSGKMSLRRKQFEVALSGNTTMLVWLGKNILGQKDKTEDENESQPIHIHLVNPDGNSTN